MMLREVNLNNYESIYSNFQQKISIRISVILIRESINPNSDNSACMRRSTSVGFNNVSTILHSASWNGIKTANSTSIKAIYICTFPLLKLNGVMHKATIRQNDGNRDFSRTECGKCQITHFAKNNPSKHRSVTLSINVLITHRMIINRWELLVVILLNWL